MFNGEMKNRQVVCCPVHSTRCFADFDLIDSISLTKQPNRKLNVLRTNVMGFSEEMHTSGGT